MPLVDVVAFLVLVAVCAYGVLAGADFGGGVWDLFARGPRKKEHRAAIARAMAPVWEANHVWLIFVIVLLFTALPGAFALLVTALFIPFHLALVGIVLRGAAFVFRAHAPRANVDAGAGARDEVTRFVRHTGVVFGVASTVTPLLLGMTMGSVSAGRLEQGGVPSATGWLSPMALFTGFLALALCAYVAAVFLAWEAQARGDEGARRGLPPPRAAHRRGRRRAHRLRHPAARARGALARPRPLHRPRALPVVLTRRCSPRSSPAARSSAVDLHLARIATVVQSRLRSSAAGGSRSIPTCSTRR